MTLEEIRKKWILRQKNAQASVDMWNSMARSFGGYTLPSFQDNSFLKLLEREDMLHPDGHVLDVGCGAGKYALAVARRCRHVTGIDLSPQMIGMARQKKDDYSIPNVDFYCGDWHTLDLDLRVFKNKFDLVFAHMTPAVQSADTFEKLSAASKDWCVLAKPIRRTDPVSDAVRALVDIHEHRESADNDIVYAFELLWRQGCLPQLEYEHQTWKMKKTLEEAYGLYINRMKTYRDLTEAEEDSIKAYLQSLVEDGFIYEDVDTTIAMLYWRVKS